MNADINQNNWADILQTGEKIEWQGSPEPGISLHGRDYFTLAFGLFFTAFSVFWMVQASRAGGIFWMFGLIHFSVGAGILLRPIIWDPMVRRKTFYTLTNKRAFIAQDIPFIGRKLKSWSLNQIGNIDFKDSEPGYIYFDEESRRSRNSWHTRQIGFERISNARKVFSLMSKLGNDLTLNSRNSTSN